VRTLVRGAMTAAPGDYTNLSAIGIEAGRDGVLSVNAGRLDSALNDPGRLSRLFTTTSTTATAQGFAVQLQALATAVTDVDGLLPARTKSLQSQISQLDKQQDRYNVRLDLIEQRLRKQYAALDAQLQTSQGTSNALAGALRQLPGSSSSR
jgi:flagellar hook-associated protein 2